MYETLWKLLKVEILQSDQFFDDFWNFKREYLENSWTDII